MSSCAELQIRLSGGTPSRYEIDLQLTLPSSDAETNLLEGKQAFMTVEPAALLELEADEEAYGRALSDAFFADPNVRTAFAVARGLTAASNLALRLRLLFDTPDLHALRWEQLIDPEDPSSFLSTLEQILVSRYLPSSDIRPVQYRPRDELRALIAVASPPNIASYTVGGQRLAPIDVSAEVRRAEQALGTLRATAATDDGPVSLSRLTQALRRGYDVLHLVCHGALIDGEPVLYLVDEPEPGAANGTPPTADGLSALQTAPVPGDVFIRRLIDLEHRPRLVVLASCESAEPGLTADGRALAALGPRLAAAGIPAVIAMQGRVSIDTAQAFTRTFFEELQAHGVIDRAAAVARRRVKDLGQPDWWMPVLFMRLKSGRLSWYEPGFAQAFRDQTDEWEGWPDLVDRIREGRCTPILGPGLSDVLLGPSPEVARTLAEQNGFPLAAYERQNLRHVIQFLSYNGSRADAEKKWRDALCSYLLEEFRDLLPEQASTRPLTELISEAGRRWRALEQADTHPNVYRVLAEYPFPLYINTDTNDLLTDALRDAGKEPRRELCRWNEYLVRMDSVFDTDPTYMPDARQPLVYHLFGHLDEKRSLVLSESDFFDFLIGITKYENQIPAYVGGQLSDSALLFLGFQLYDWPFRVILRNLMNMDGGRLFSDYYTHVVAQVNPNEEQSPQPEGMRAFLEKLFRKTDINIFWGTVGDFVKHMQDRLHPTPV